MAKDTFTPFLRKYRATLNKHGKVGVQIASDRVRDHAMVDHKYVDRTGLLTKSMKSNKVTSRFGIIKGKVKNGSIVALFIHEGTGLHGPYRNKYEIKPKKAKALAFERPANQDGSLTGNAGQLVFRKKVMHPGIEPDPFLTRALHEETPFFNRIMASVIKRAAKDAAASLGAK